MLTVIRKDIWAHKRRLASTLLAVVLGVAFLSGTLVLSDTMRANFADLFGQANAGTAVVVRPQPVDADAGEEGGARGATLDEALVDTLRAVPGVATAEPSVEGFGRLVGRDGQPIGGSGPPTVAGTWVEEPQLNPYKLVEGAAPRAGDEVVVNRAAVERGGFALGDTLTVLTPEPTTVRLVGVSTFGDVDSAGGLTFTAFTLEGAQQAVTGQPGRVSTIALAAADGVSPDDLVARVQAVLPADVQAITGAQLTAEQQQDINTDFLDFFTWFLRAFALVAVVVAAFSIYNTFSILAAQRTRESALLRALGASRRQVLVASLAEALIVAVVASGLGLVAGLGIATALKALLAGFGFAVPASGLALTAGAVLTSVAVGVVVTLVSALAPAVRSSRVRPLAALRDVAVERRAVTPLRVVSGLVAVALGGAGVVAGAVGGAGAGVAGLGSLLTIVGVVVLGPAVAGLASRVIGAPLPRLRGTTGALARQNARRNPRRTASTASALMIGVAVVTLFTVLGSSITASFTESVQRSFGGDLVISGTGFDGGFSTDLAGQVRSRPEVAAASGIGNVGAVVDGRGEQLVSVDPAGLAATLDLDVQTGSLADLGPGQLAVSRARADERGWSPGTAVPVTFGDGTSADLTVTTVFGDPDVTGDLIVSRATTAPHTPQPVDQAVLVALAPGVDLASGRDAVTQVAAAYPGTKVQDRDQYLDEVAGSVNQVLSLVYVLLALAVVIALMGIANTLSLSVHERTRELGLLRAVGQTRGQVRSMVRWESVIIALFGTLGGLGLGAFLGWALVRAASSGAVGAVVSAPVVPLVVVLVVGGLAGVLAGLRPARRAARLDVLDALAA